MRLAYIVTPQQIQYVARRPALAQEFEPINAVVRINQRLCGNRADVGCDEGDHCSNCKESGSHRHPQMTGRFITRHHGPCHLSGLCPSALSYRIQISRLEFPALALNVLDRRYLVTQSDQRLHSFRGFLQQIFRGAPCSRLSEQYDCRSPKSEDGFLFSAYEGPFVRMDLHNPSDGQRSDFCKTQSAKVFCFENLDVSLITKQNIRLITQRVGIDGPESRPQAVSVERQAIVRIVQMMIIYGCKSSQDHRAAFKGASSIDTPQEGLSVEGMTLDREFLPRQQLVPGEVTRFSERSHA